MPNRKFEPCVKQINSFICGQPGELGVVGGDRELIKSLNGKQEGVNNRTKLVCVCRGGGAGIIKLSKLSFLVYPQVRILFKSMEKTWEILVSIEANITHCKQSFIGGCRQMQVYMIFSQNSQKLLCLWGRRERERERERERQTDRQTDRQMWIFKFYSLSFLLIYSPSDFLFYRHENWAIIFLHIFFDTLLW